ncbi:amino acid adenylation domain-containing protein [Streptomyces sp. NPDC021020]|uniref:amino acid adenylation domain-containing protein n=1 Tax=Streptomyces sp. NPDC021020 TaxID=3365109 RepID=UPI00378753F0
MFPSLVDAVLETAGRTPRRYAVVEGGHRLTYAELAAQASALAAGLARRGVGRGDRVGVLLAPGADCVAATVAALMAGAAYVPLDPEQPSARTRAMLERCGARICVAAGPDAPEAVADCPVVPVAELAEAGQAGAAPFRADDVAYVIHTSGSTGTPKGVQIEHRSVLNLVAELDRLAPPGPAPVGSWWTRPSFDVAVWESWSPLMNGGTLVVVPDRLRLEGPRVVAWLAEQEVTSAYLPGAFLPDLASLLRSGAAACAKLTRLLVGVEPIPLGTLQDLMELRPGLRVVNGYGPAETTICCTLFPVPRTGGNRAERTPIGRAVAGNRLYVLGEDGALSPTGAGELAVAGVGVSRGYLGAPAAESARFTAEPGGGGGRCYRTGDLVRTLPDGDLVFEGRADRQLKVRGYRVEPGEVEAALHACADLQDAVVAGRTADGSALIAAYVVPSPGTALGREALAVGLRRILPVWAVPSLIVPLERVPLTANGKVDHAALAALEVPRAPAARGAAAAASSTERRLAELWAQVLGGPVGPDDDFLLLGGHSLAAARICARTREEFGCDITVADLLAAPTVAGLAAVVDAAERDGPGVLPWTPQDGRYPLSFAQERMWLLDRMMPGSRDYLLHEAHLLRGALDVAALRAAFGDVVQRHAALRSTFHEDRGVPYQRVADDVPVPFEVRDLPGATAARIAEVIDAEARRPFGLDTGPLLRVTLLRLAPEEHVLLLVLHHIAADDGSMDVLWSDLRAFHRRRVSGAPAPVPLPVGYPDFAAWQRAPRQTAALAGHLDHWRRELAGAPLTLELPADFPRAVPAESVDATVPFALPPGAAAALAELARARRVTPYTVLLSGFAVTVAATAGQDDFVVASFSGQRGRVELEPMVGMFVNTVALRMRCGGDPSFAELVDRVRDAVLGAFAHQDLPFDRLVSALRPPRDLTRHPVAQVGFQVLAARRDRLRLSGLDCSPYAAGQGGSPLDVLVEVEEGGEGGADVTGRLHYRPDLFTPERARRLAGRYAAVLARGVADPALPLSRLTAGE